MSLEFIQKSNWECYPMRIKLIEDDRIDIEYACDNTSTGDREYRIARIQVHYSDARTAELEVLKSL